MHLIRIVRAWPIPVAITTILAGLSAIWLVLFSVGAFSTRGMSFFEAVGLPMQLGVIGMGFFLFVRLMRNRPASAIRSVPMPIRILVPVAVAVGALQMAHIPASMPATTPTGQPVRTFNLAVEQGVCIADYNGSERVPEPLQYCATYQRKFNQVFAGAWLLFSALELWGAWAIYGAPPVQRVPSDQRQAESVRREPGTDMGVRVNRPYLWLTVRVGIIVYAAASGWRGFGQSEPISGIMLLFAGLWGAVATRYWIVQAYTAATRTEPWLLPSWFVNPFQRSQPFQFFHVAAMSFIALGLSQTVRAILSGRHFSLTESPVEMFAAAFGLGILLGIHWATVSYRSRFTQAQVF
jgi:hypothetical protein